MTYVIGTMKKALYLSHQIPMLYTTVLTYDSNYDGSKSWHSLLLQLSA